MDNILIWKWIWIVIGIYDFIDWPVDNVPSMSAWTVCWDTWPLGSNFCFMDIRQLLRVWQYIIRLTRFRELGHTESQSEFNTSEFSGLNNTTVIASKMFLDAMADLFGNRCALCNTARDEIHIPWVNYHLVVNHEGAGKNLGLWGPLWPFESSFIFQMSLGGAFIATYSKKYRRIFKTIFLRNTESVVLILWKLTGTGNFEWVPGPLRPPLAVWGLNSVSNETEKLLIMF